MDPSFQCSGCGAEMFEGAHFCMACGSPLHEGAARDSSEGYEAPEASAFQAEVDDEWDPALGARAHDSLVPDDDLEIQELDAAAEPHHDSRRAQQALEALKQVRDYLIELDLDTTPSTKCLSVCRNVLKSLNGTAEALGADVARACLDLALALELPASAEQGYSFAALLPVKQRYNELAKLVPDLGDFEAERRRRVTLIVRSILEQVPGLGPLQRAKLSQAGLNDVEKLQRASQADLEAAGLTHELAQRVAERIQRFKRRLDSIPPETGRAAERQRLRRLINQLEQQNHKFETLTNDWSKGSHGARQEVRDERAETMSQVSLLLVRLGELGVAERLEKLPFEQKVCELERLLGALDDTHGHIGLVAG